MDLSRVVVCSFHTADDYYASHGEALRRNLERLEIAHEIQEIDKQPGEEWPDICRKKIPFLAGVCDDHPDARVFWIDVDCQLTSLPPFVTNSSADLIGFQRGFGSPLTIGYANRTRFWEPCFFGINASPGGRAFIDDARQFEAEAEIRATDDYFFEESWRKNAHLLSFQLIPSVCVLGRSDEPLDGLTPFFSFGSSGKVAEFKGSVVQHTSLSPAHGGLVVPFRRRFRIWARDRAKGIQSRLPEKTSQTLRRVSDRTGVTQYLTGGGADALQAGPAGAATSSSPHRRRIVEQMIMAAQRGDRETMIESFSRLSASGIPTKAETLARQAADTFVHYANGDDNTPIARLAWWPRPFPGNFGDWLSPLVIAQCTGTRVHYQSPTARSSEPHIVGVGSIGRFIKPSSVVVGTGVSSNEYELDPKATYFSLRGPQTAKLLKRSGGPSVDSFGDPGVLLSRVWPMERGETNGRLALVRHFTHASIPLVLPPDVDEIDVLMSHPDDIKRFLETLIQYDGVVTSAMHVMIACHSYGIPCHLVGFEGFEASVAGTGLKYGDYSLGVGIDRIDPEALGIDLRRANLRDRLAEIRVSEAKLDEIEDRLKAGVAAHLAAVA